jgi:2-dehydropantoate 2-reductase
LSWSVQVGWLCGRLGGMSGLPNNFPPVGSIAWVGTGALGLFYASRQIRAAAGGVPQVGLLVRSGRAEIAAEGLWVESIEGDYHLPGAAMRMYGAPNEMPPVDLVCIGLKATANGALGELVGPLLKEGTHILTLQNGLGNEEVLARLFGPERVLGGCAFVAVTREGPTRLRHKSEGFIHMGELAGGPTARTAAVAGVFEAAGIRVQQLASLAAGRWEKLIWNAAFNGLGASLGRDTGDLLSTAEGEGLVRAVMGEIVAVAGAEGHVFAPDIVDRKIAFTRPMGSYRTSMQVDRELGRAMEVDMIISEPIRRAERWGVAVPKLREIERRLRD